METEKQSDSIAKQFLKSFSNCIDLNHHQNEHKAAISKEELRRHREVRNFNQSRSPINT